MKPGRSQLLALYRFSQAGSAAVVFVGVAVVVGWVLDVPILKSFLPSLASMKVNTACAFIAAGSALWLLHTSAIDSVGYRSARVLALCLLAFAALTLTQDIFALDLGVDQFLLPDPAPSLHPGRMSPVTSFNFIIIGFALLGLKANRFHVAACAHWVLLAPLFISLLAILGYIYGVSALYQVKPFNSVALHTALTFFILILSIKAADPMHGIVNIMASNTAGGAVSRRLLPSIPPFLIGLGWLCVFGQDAGYYDTHFGIALMISASIAVCVFAIVRTGYALRRIDLTRAHAESEIVVLEQQSLHDGLTGIANRRFLDTYLANQIAIARRHERPLSILLCDIDDFKSYNDCYGHLVGDECLKKVAAALRACCRRPGDMAARYGGEEFVLILPDSDINASFHVAESARKAVAELRIPHARCSTGAWVSISGGVALWKLDTTGEELLAAADVSLYRAKREGRNRMIASQDQVKSVKRA